MAEGQQEAQNAKDSAQNSEDASTLSSVKSPIDMPKQEVSAQTIGRMMGLATISDLKLLDSKVDLITTKLSGVVIKVDKALTLLNSVPTAADMERLDVQIGSVKTVLRETVESIKEIVAATKK